MTPERSLTSYRSESPRLSPSVRRPSLGYSDESVPTNTRICQLAHLWHTAVKASVHDVANFAPVGRLKRLFFVIDRQVGPGELTPSSSNHADANGVRYVGAVKSTAFSNLEPQLRERGGYRATLLQRRYSSVADILLSRGGKWTSTRTWRTSRWYAPDESRSDGH